MSIPLNDRVWLMEGADEKRLHRAIQPLIRKDPELRRAWLKAGREFVVEMNRMALAWEMEQDGRKQLMDDHYSHEERRLSVQAEQWSMANDSQDDQLWCESHAY